MIRLIGVFLFLVVYFIISLPIQLAELIIQKFNMDIRNKSSLSFVQWGLKCVMFISGVKLEVTGYENIPKDTPVLFVGNHNSFYDIIVTYPLMERPTGFVAKKEIKKARHRLLWILPKRRSVLLRGTTLIAEGAAPSAALPHPTMRPPW